MALRSQLFRRIPATIAALRPPAAVPRRLVSQFHQGTKGHWLSSSSNSRESSRTDVSEFVKHDILAEQYKKMDDINKAMDQRVQMFIKEMKLCDQALIDFEKNFREALQGLAKSRERVEKIGKVGAAAGVGVFLLAIVAKCSL